jgi:hypothetical protein
MSITVLKIITNPLGVAVLVTVLVLILYSCGANVIKLAIYTFIITAVVVSLNNSYLMNEFEKERKLEGSFPSKNPYLE